MVPDSFFAYLYNMLFTPWWLGAILYWLPVAVNSVVYTLRTIRETHQDVKRRSQAAAAQGIYRPVVTVGVIVGRVLATGVPFINAWMLVTDTAWSLTKGLINFFGEILDFPVVPERKSATSRHRNSRPGT